MRLEVTRQMDADRRAATFLEVPVVVSPDAMPQPSELAAMVGHRIGPYRIVRDWRLWRASWAGGIKIA